MAGFFQQYWRGQLSLTQTCLVGISLIGVLLLVVAKWILPSLASTGTWPVMTIALTAGFVCAVIVLWQVVGLWRCWRLQETVRSAFDGWMLALASVVYITVLTFSLVDLSRYSIDPEVVNAPDRPAAQTALQYLPDTDPATAFVSGEIMFGLRERLETLLEENPQITRIVLSSPGGVLGEARGVANVIKKAQVETRVVDQCASACTLMYVAGKTRTISAGASIGFHQYVLKALYRVPGLDESEEQARDTAFFISQGVRPRFMSRAFEASHDSLWKPDHDTLIQAGIVHRVVD